VKTMKKKKSVRGFWAIQSQRWLESWRRFWSLRTLAQIGYDLALALFIVATYVLFLGIFSQFVEPLRPTLEAMQQLDAAGAPAEDRRALIQTYAPDINGVLLKSFLVGLSLLLACVACYALVKTKVWASVLHDRFSWRRYGRNLLLSVIWAIIITGIPGLFLKSNPVLAAYLFVAFLGLTLIVLPLLYATAWQAIGRGLLWNYLVVLLVQLITWLIVANVLGLLLFVNQWLYLSIIVLWAFLFLAWGRHYVATLVEAHR